MTSDDDRVAYLADDRSGPVGRSGPPVGSDDADDLDDLRDLLADPGLWGEPPASLEGDVVAAVTAAASAAAPPAPGADRRAAPAPAAPAERPDAGEPTTAGGAISLDERRERRRRGVAPWAAGAVAAAAVVVVGVLVVRSADDGADAPAFAASLRPTELAPDASGEVTATRTDSGWRIELDATGLPRLDDGRFYEAWLRGPDDVLVPVGTFNEGADVVLWAGVSPEDFATFTVTRELADGDQTSSGERVLAGPIEPAD